MVQFIQEQLLFYFSLAIVFFVPGYFFMLAFFGRKNFSFLERFVVSIGASIILVDFLMLLIGRFGAYINRFSILTGVALIVLICFLVYKFKHNENSQERNELFSFSPRQVYLIIFIVFISIFIRTAYLNSSILPSSTDLGHHMYWAKKIVETKSIPNYTMRDIVVGENYAIGAPKNISDFIIGEHLIFASIGSISGLNFISYFPILTLFLIDIATVLALFVLVLRLFENNPNAKNIAICALLLVGPLFAIAPPQAKYAGGGVIGNLIGNLLFILVFYFFARALNGKNKVFGMLFLFFSMGLFYTHHLTGFIFLMVMALFILAFFIFDFKKIKDNLIDWGKIIFSLPVLIFAVFAVIFVLLIYTPTYLTNGAVTTVVGEVTKVDHTGLPLDQFKSIVGEARITLGLIGLLLIFVFYDKKQKISYLLLASWTFLITLTSLSPQTIKLDIPSGRIANYGTYPLAIMGAFAFVSVFNFLKKGREAISGSGRKLIFSSFLLILTFAAVNGLGDSSDYFSEKNDSANAVKTFNAADYLSKNVSSSDILLSDHINVDADSWIKLFFMRDYNFSLYRANLDRYENGIDRQEKCTLEMISSPNGPESQKCFADLNVNFVLVNDMLDSSQFKRADNFQEVYSNGYVSAFYRNK